VVFDEPTADLDPATARAIMDLIWSLDAARTVIVITHRPVTLDRASQIVRLG
jgi:ABC-type transport system involved in cytochrome bd biosynthesis fused ATPase/permease subunit